MAQDKTHLPGIIIVDDIIKQFSYMRAWMSNLLFSVVSLSWILMFLRVTTVPKISISLSINIWTSVYFSSLHLRISCSHYAYSYHLRRLEINSPQARTPKSCMHFRFIEEIFFLSQCVYGSLSPVQVQCNWLGTNSGFTEHSIFAKVSLHRR